MQRRRRKLAAFFTASNAKKLLPPGAQENPAEFISFLAVDDFDLSSRW
jgi:hypothetical protein